jgi:2-oxoglutarate ferredoxin oxidoreductase subunit delta
MKMRTNHRQTDFIRFNAHKCKACWNCVNTCPEILGKIDILWHKHVQIVYPDRCIGCLQCVKACPVGAFSPIQKQVQ